jgi:hypothetical protein
MPLAEKFVKVISEHMLLQGTKTPTTISCALITILAKNKYLAFTT